MSLKGKNLLTSALLELNFKKGKVLLPPNIKPTYLKRTTLIRLVATDFYLEKT